MDEYGGITFDEAAKAIKSITEKLYEQRPSGYEELYQSIEMLTSKEFADEAVQIVDAKHNQYSLLEQYGRMYDAISLLQYGASKDDLRKLLETHTEQIAIKLIGVVD